MKNIRSNAFGSSSKYICIFSTKKKKVNICVCARECVFQSSQKYVIIFEMGNMRMYAMM